MIEITESERPGGRASKVYVSGQVFFNRTRTVQVGIGKGSAGHLCWLTVEHVIPVPSIFTFICLFCLFRFGILKSSVECSFHIFGGCPTSLFPCSFKKFLQFTPLKKIHCSVIYFPSVIKLYILHACPLNPSLVRSSSPNTTAAEEVCNCRGLICTLLLSRLYMCLDCFRCATPFVQSLLFSFSARKAPEIGTSTL